MGALSPLPEEDWVFTPSELDTIKEAYEILTRPDEFLPSSPDWYRKPVDVKIRTGSIVRRVWVTRALLVVAWEIAAAVVLERLITAVVETGTEESPEARRKRRRNRLQLCVSLCLRELTVAREAIEGGYMEHRALETTSDTRIRKNREFRSRAKKVRAK